MDYRDMDFNDRDDFPTGDPRRCRVHPHVTTSSADGMFDAPCGQCEHESYEADMSEMYGDEEPAAVDPVAVLPALEDEDDILF